MTRKSGARDYRCTKRMALTRTPTIRYDMQIKLIVLGDTCVGKSCILLRYVDDIFKLSYMSTIGKSIATARMQQFSLFIVSPVVCMMQSLN